MNAAVVYHWWSEHSDAPPMRNLRTPILLSIATLRAHEPDVPVYVLDGSKWDHNRSYEDYPERLGFTVVPCEFHLAHYDHRPGWRHLSRIFDVQRLAQTISEDTIIYCDTDVFWKKSPLPLGSNPEKFCFNQFNSGYFYYQKDSPHIRRFMEIFEAYTLTALNDDNFRFVSRQWSRYDWYYVFDEAILGYMYNKHRELFNIISLEEHCTPSTAFPDNNPANLDPVAVRMVHCNGIRVANKVPKQSTEKEYCRGLVPLLIKEFYDGITKFIEPSEAYTLDEIDHHLPFQAEFCNPDFIKCLMQSCGEDDLYDLMYALQKFHQG